jgi:integrase
VFVSERKAPLTSHTVRKIVARAGRQAGIAFPIHPHMLRHATGYKPSQRRTGHQGDPAIPRASGEIEGWDTGLTN